MRHLVLTLAVVLGVVSTTFLMGRQYLSHKAGFDGAEVGRSIPAGLDAPTQQDYYEKEATFSPPARGAGRRCTTLPARDIPMSPVC